MNETPVTPEELAAFVAALAAGCSYWEKLPGETGNIEWRLDAYFKSSFREITRN